MNEAEIRRKFPNASQQFVRANLHNEDERTAAIVEHHTGNEPLETPCFQKGDGGHFLVTIKSYRRRLLDEDNLCEKYLVDLLRYSGIIPGDSPDTTHINVSQEKVGKDENEEIDITVERIP